MVEEATGEVGRRLREWGLRRMDGDPVAWVPAMKLFTWLGAHVCSTEGTQSQEGAETPPILCSPLQSGSFQDKPGFWV